MCLIAFAFDCHQDYRLVLMANRDEFRSRETERAAFWADAPHLLAGRDRQAGGTWLGITTGGKIAAITNYRDPRQQVSNPPSRGSLVADYLRDESMTPADLRAHLQKHGNSYDGFNLIYGTARKLHYYTNRGGSSGPVAPGVHGLSNHLLDTRWPKLVEARRRLERILRSREISPEACIEAMADPSPFSDELLPDTGIGPEFERFLSPLLITGERYATRSTGVLLVGHGGDVTFCEKSYDDPASPTACFRFRLGGEQE